MTIELLAESFREAKAKAGHPARIKYAEKLKAAAIEYFKANPSLTHVPLSPPEFFEKLAAIIPPPNRHQVNYYGYLSSHSRLRPLIVQGQKVDAGPEEKKPSHSCDHSKGSHPRDPCAFESPDRTTDEGKAFWN